MHEEARPALVPFGIFHFARNASLQPAVPALDLVPTVAQSRQQGTPKTLDTPETPFSPHAMPLDIHVGAPIFLETEGNYKAYLSLALHSYKPVKTVSTIDTSSNAYADCARGDHLVTHSALLQRKRHNSVLPLSPREVGGT